MKTKAEHGTVIKLRLAEVERTLRAHHRAVVSLHKALAEATTDYGDALQLDEGTIAAAAVPKNAPPNEPEG